jgi:hypothetical protein
MLRTTLLIVVWVTGAGCNRHADSQSSPPIAAAPAETPATPSGPSAVQARTPPNDPPADQEERVESAGEDPELAEKLAYLIEQLASKNVAPAIHGDARRGFEDQAIKFEKPYDASLQVPVYLAIQQLLHEDAVAVDWLISHADDQRYSLSVNGYQDENISVTEACRMIARAKVFSFEDDLRLITRDQQNAFSFGEGGRDFADWWNENRGRGLVALQIEVIDANISFFQTADVETASPVHPQAEPLSEDDFNRGRDENVRKLKAIRACIAATGKPYQAAKLMTGQHIFGLPWSWRKHNL